MEYWWALIEKMICDFHAFLAPTVPRFKIEEGIDCEHQTSWAISSTLEKCGVYLIFDASESLKYIGVTGCLTKRIQGYRNEDRFVPRWIDVFPIDSRFDFLAFALEPYLIYGVSGIEGNELVNRRGNHGYIDLSLFIEDPEEVPEKVALPHSRKEKAYTMGEER